MEEHRKEKLVAFRNISLNLLNDTIHISFNRAEFFSKLVFTLIPDELKLLHTFYLLDVKGTLSHYDKMTKKRDIYYIVEKVWNSTDKEYIRALVTDCARYQLISGSPEQKRRYSREGLFLTDLGREFVEYIFNPIEVELYE